MKKMPSVVWLLAEKLNSQDARCKICNKIIKFCGTPTNIRRHLTQKHPSALARVTETESQAESDLDLDNVDDIHIINNEVEIEEVDADQLQPSSSSSIPKPKRKCKRSFLEYFIHNCSQPDPGQQTAPNPTLSDVDEIQNTSLARQCTSSSSQIPSIAVSSLSPTVESKDQSLKICIDKLLSYKRGGDMDRKITGSLIYLIVQNCLPFSIVETEAFKQFLHVTCPHYQIPCATTITNMIDKEFEALFEIEKKKFENIKSFSLTIDAWTESHSLSSILGITGHYISADGELNSIMLGSMEITEQHTSEIISSYIEEVLDNWAIKNKMITAVTTDNGENIVGAIKLLDEAHHICCFAYMLNLVLTAAFDDARINAITEIVNSVKEIITWFHTSNITAHERKKVEELYLIQSCPTRWNSTSYMIRLFLKLEKSVSNILSAHKNAPNMVDDNNIAIIEDIFPILELFDKMTKDCTQEKTISASRIIPICDFMESTLQEIVMKTDVGRKFLSIIQDAFHKQFKDVESHYIFSICTLLDPRYKKIHFRDAIKCSKAVSRLNALLVTSQNTTDSVQSSVEDDSISGIEKPQLSELDYFTAKKSHSVIVQKPCEISTYLKSATINISSDPLKYWYTNRNEYPQLYEVVKKFLCVQGSSTPCEQSSSLAGFIMNARRNRITMQCLERLLLMKHLP